MVISGIVEITMGDSILEELILLHTPLHLELADGPGNIFDSGLYGPGKSFTHNFDEIGFYPCYCLVHPWMSAVILIDAYS